MSFGVRFAPGFALGLAASLAEKLLELHPRFALGHRVGFHRHDKESPHCAALQGRQKDLQFVRSHRNLPHPWNDPNPWSAVSWSGT